jgi:predicted O-methyltransferase YrrM
MDTDRFRTELPAVFDGDLDADHPVDRQFRRVMDDVPGMSSENALALVHLAAGLLPEDEAYLEVGSYKGLSLTAAMLGNPKARFHAIESFREFGVDPVKSRDELFANLRRWVDTASLSFHEGDCFRILDRRGAIDEPVGVYFYDGIHGRLAHYLALGIAEPLLADEALVIIDDASWTVVSEATDAYVSRHPGYELLFDLPAHENYEAKWWNGIRVYRYRRSPGAPAGRGFDLRWRRAVYLYAYEPVMHLAWKVLIGRPRLMAFLRRVLPTKGVKGTAGK